MLQYALKVLVMGLVIVAVAEIAKRYPFWAAIATSVPAVSVLAIVLLYVDTGDVPRVATLSHMMFWLTFPSLALVGTLPLLLRLGWPFWPSFAASWLAFGVTYVVVVWVIDRLRLAS
jgi:hypothetical protein